MENCLFHPDADAWYTLSVWLAVLDGHRCYTVEDNEQ